MVGSAEKSAQKEKRPKSLPMTAHSCSRESSFKPGCPGFGGYFLQSRIHKAISTFNTVHNIRITVFIIVFLLFRF